MYLQENQPPVDADETLKKTQYSTRQKIDLLLSKDPAWARIAELLYSNNHHKAYGFLKDITQIDPDSADEEKTNILLDIINKYSEHTAIHSRQIRNIFENMQKYRNLDGFEAIKNIDFKSLATAMERHDVGKIIMPENILHKNGIYNEKDTLVKEKHPLMGYLILRALGFDEKSLRFALTHHLKYKTMPNGRISIAGYPKKAFLKYCKESGQKAELTPDDHLAGFTDVFSALMDINRPTDVYGTHDPKIGESERCKKAFDIMDTKIFNDTYYLKGEGASIYSAFKNAMMKIAIQSDEIRMAA